MISWIVKLICVGFFVWLCTKFEKYTKMIEGIADDIYDIKKKLGFKPEPRTENKYYFERKAEIASALQREVALQEGDIKKAINLIKEISHGQMNKYMSEKEIMSLVETAKWCVEEDQQKIKELAKQGKSYEAICEAFEGEDEYREGWNFYAYKQIHPNSAKKATE